MPYSKITRKLTVDIFFLFLLGTAVLVVAESILPGIAGGVVSPVKAVLVTAVFVAAVVFIEKRRGADGLPLRPEMPRLPKPAIWAASGILVAATMIAPLYGFGLFSLVVILSFSLFILYRVLE